MRALLLLTVLLTAPALAASPRTGGLVYGDFRSDSPGTIRRILPTDLPAPFASRVGVSLARIVPRPMRAQPVAPPGFAVTLFASGLFAPRTLRTAPDGSVFVAEVGLNRVLRIAADGTRSVFAEGLNGPFGIAFWPPAAPSFVYIGEIARVTRYPWTPGQPFPAGAAQVVVPSLPGGGHITRDLAVSPDGARLFVAVGSSSNVTDLEGAPPGGIADWQAAHGLGASWAEDTGRADVLQFAPDGQGLRSFAQGLRNCAGLAVQPGTGTPWCVVNERDELGDNLPPDYAAGMREGTFYGWPWYYIGAHPDPSLHGARPDLAAQVTLPDVLFQAHSAPLGIAFYNAKLFPSAYRGDAFVTLHGSWNRSRPTGYKVVRLPLAGGRGDGSYQDFLTGFTLLDGSIWGRPVGVTVAGDGALLVSEDASGTIWRVAPTQ
jgi:glucose/arabinose dehydrogenase